MKSKLNVLLTGGSGTVGTAVLEQLMLQKDKYSVTIFDRKSKESLKSLNSYTGHFKIVFGDISDINDVYNVCENKDVVIHLAAIIPPLADDNPKLARDVNVVGTKNLMEALERRSPNCFVLYSSSISVYGDRINNPDIKIDAALRPSIGDEYAKTKIAAEEIVQSSNLSWSIFRLTAIMGYGNHKISKLMFHMPLNTQIEIATPVDTGRAFVNAMEKKDQLENKIFNLGGGEECRISYNDFLNRSFVIMGLGHADFPDQSFAKSNFHCGNYMDGDNLEKILKFRGDSIESYFKKLQLTISPFKYFLTFLFRRWIKQYLLKLSEPYELIQQSRR